MRITDAAGATDIATAELEVVNAARCLTSHLLGNGPVVRGRSLSLSARADDPDLTGESLRVSWDLDGDGTFEHPGGTVQNGQTVELAYTPAVTGVQDVAVEMIDDAGGAGTARLRAGRRREPAAAHLAHPERGGRQEGRRGHLRRGEQDPDSADGTVRIAWDPEGDGTFEAESPGFLPAARTIRVDTAGARTVAVRVRDELNTVTASAMIRVVDNLPPTAALSVFPSRPRRARPSPSTRPIRRTPTAR